MDTLVLALRGVARLAAVASVAYLMLVAGDGVPQPASDSDAVLTGLLFAVVAANMAGWLWPILASCFGLSSGIAYVGLTLRGDGLLPDPWLLAVLFLPGLLHIAGEAAGRNRYW